MLVRRRYYYWLFKAYVKRWRKTIITSIILGITVFFALVLILNYFILPVFSNKYEKIGYAGTYTLNTLPEEVLKNVSYGLTTVADNSEIKPGAAKNWKVSQNGKIYTFTLKNDLKLSNGKDFDIKNLPYSFKDVKKKILDKNKIEFTLNSPYAPFLSVLEKPIIYRNMGFNDYRIGKIEENSGFIKSLTLVSDHANRKIIYFYPTEDALRTAFVLGEVSTAKDLSVSQDPEQYFKNWRNVQVTKQTDYKNLVSVFFNTNDKLLSNKKARQALVFSLPKNFKEGERTFSFIPPHSIYYSESPNEGILDLELSRSLLESAGEKNPKITLETNEENLETAKEVAKAWDKLGVKTEIKTVSGIPVNFQAFLTVVKVPKDPDMYVLWHSSQPSNISHYKNVRIDKLLEDGRQSTSQEERIRIYADMQKYILDDAPAAFLYFPYSYTVSRK